MWSRPSGTTVLCMGYHVTTSPHRPGRSTPTPTSTHHNYLSLFPRRLLPQQPTNPPPKRLPMAPMAAVLLPLHDPQIPLGLSGTALRFWPYVVSCAVWSACEGMASLDLPPPAFGRSVVRVGPCRSPNSWALFCGWVPPSAGLRFGRRKITNYKLQITSRNTSATKIIFLLTCK